MHLFTMHSLVDITKNSNLAKTFPFETDAGDMIEDKQTLKTARNQNSNFNTMIQILQLRGNIVWEQDPLRLYNDHTITKFGSYYEGTNISWHFNFPLQWERLEDLEACLGVCVIVAKAAIQPRSSVMRLRSIWAPASAGVTAIFDIFSAHYCYCEPIAKISCKMVRSVVEIVRIGA